MFFAVVNKAAARGKGEVAVDLPFVSGIGKMLWNGQTEPFRGTRSCTLVQREVKFVRNKRRLKREKHLKKDVFRLLLYIL